MGAREPVLEKTPHDYIYKIGSVSVLILVLVKHTRIVVMFMLSHIKEAICASREDIR